MKKFKFPKTLEVDLLELITFQLRYILMDKNLMDAEIKILAYVYVYKSEAINHVIKAGILKSRKSVENYISVLRKLGLIHGSRNKTKLHPQIFVFSEDIEFSIKLKLKEVIDD